MTVTGVTVSQAGSAPVLEAAAEGSGSALQHSLSGTHGAWGDPVSRRSSVDFCGVIILVLQWTLKLKEKKHTSK